MADSPNEVEYMRRHLSTFAEGVPAFDNRDATEQGTYYQLLDAAANYLRTMGIESMVFDRPEIRHSNELVIKFTSGDNL